LATTLVAKNTPKVYKKQSIMTGLPHHVRIALTTTADNLKAR
jgi:hypothetical protein